MKQVLRVFSLSAIVILISCGGNNNNEEKSKKEDSVQMNESKSSSVSDVPASERVDLVSKGIGPIKNIDLPEAIDQTMAIKGEEIFKSHCMACHKPAKRFVGPAPKGILERRTPEWIMNMILNPVEMTQNDPLARELLIEFNGSPMANQNLSEEEVRQILEYFRTL